MTKTRRITETGQAYNALFHKPFILSIIRLPPFSYTPGLGHELVPVLLKKLTKRELQHDQDQAYT